MIEQLLSCNDFIYCDLRSDSISNEMVLDYNAGADQRGAGSVCVMTGKSLPWTP